MNVNKVFAKKPMWLRKYISLIVPLSMNFFVILHITYVDMEFIEVRYKVLYIQAHRDYANIWGEKCFVHLMQSTYLNSSYCNRTTVW